MRLARAPPSRPDLQQAASPCLPDRCGKGRVPAVELHPERPQAEVRLGSEQGLAPPVRPAPEKALAGQPDARELPGKQAAADHPLPAEAGRGPAAPSAPELAHDARAAPRRDGRTPCRAPAGRLVPPPAVLARGSGLDKVPSRSKQFRGAATGTTTLHANISGKTSICRAGRNESALARSA